MLLIALALVISACIFTFYWHRDLDASSQRARQENEASIENILEYIHTAFNDIRLLADELRRTSWVVKLYADADVFVEHYDYLQRQELIDDFLFYTGSNSRITERFLFFPKRNICIADDMWVSAGFYFGSVGVEPTDQGGLAETISNCNDITHIDTFRGSCFDKSILIVIPIQKIRSPRAYLGTFLSKAILSKEIANCFSSGMESVRFVHSSTGNTVLEIGKTDRAEPNAVYELKYIDWTCEFRINESLTHFELGSMLRSILVYLTILSVLVIIAAYLLASFLYRPVQKLAGKFDMISRAPGRREDEYEWIGSSIDLMMRSFEESRRVTFIRRVLIGEVEQEEEIKDVPFLHAACFQVLYIIRLEKNAEYAEVEIIRTFVSQHPGLTCELLELGRDELVAIIGYSNPDHSEVLADQLIRQLHEIENVSVFAGEIVNNWQKINESYQQARKKLVYLGGYAEIRYHFPLDWESRLIACLRDGDENQVTDILRELKRQNEQRLNSGKMDENDFWKLEARLVSDIRRIYMETGLDQMTNMDGAASPTEFWLLLEDSCRALCASLREKLPQKNNIAQQVADYISLHCFDPDISLVSVQEAFGLSDKTIGKYVQSITGMKFLNYLTKLRMEEAKRLLSEKKMKPAQIAEYIGYASDFSFQRAFYRYTGIKVQDYMEQPGKGSHSERQED